MLYAEPDKTLAGVANFLSDPRRPIETTLRAMMTTPHLGDRGVHPVIVGARVAEQERQRTLPRAVDRDVVPRPLPRSGRGHGDPPMRLAHPRPGGGSGAGHALSGRAASDISRTKPLVRLILNQIGRRLTEELEPKRRRHRLLLMLDEFPALGRLDFFESALAFMAGYGLKSFLIAQSLNQIEKARSHDLPRSRHNELAMNLNSPRKTPTASSKG